MAQYFFGGITIHLAANLCDCGTENPAWNLNVDESKIWLEVWCKLCKMRFAIPCEKLTVAFSIGSNFSEEPSMPEQVPPGDGVSVESIGESNIVSLAEERKKVLEQKKAKDGMNASGDSKNPPEPA